MSMSQFKAMCMAEDSENREDDIEEDDGQFALAIQ